MNSGRSPSRERRFVLNFHPDLQRDADRDALPASDVDPVALSLAEEFLKARKVPHRPQFTPSTLAKDLGGTTRTWQKRCESGEITAVRDGRDFVVVWPWLVRYIAARLTVNSRN